VNRNFKCVLSVARSEYIKWITNPRVIIVGVLLVFMRTLAIEPLLERAAKMEIPLTYSNRLLRSETRECWLCLCPAYLWCL